MSFNKYIYDDKIDDKIWKMELESSHRASIYIYIIIELMECYAVQVLQHSWDEDEGISQVALSTKLRVRLILLVTATPRTTVSPLLTH